MKTIHILMYRFRDDVSDSRIDEHLAFIESMRGQFDGLLDLACGRDDRAGETKAKKYTHGFVMTFASREALAAYNQSELHDRLVQGFRDDVEDKVVFDFDVP